MNAWLDDSLVALVLSSSAVYALLTLGPKGLRRQIYAWLAAALRRLPAAGGLRPLAEKLRERSAAGAASGCGGCGDCESAAMQPAAQEVKVPIARIGRRK